LRKVIENKMGQLYYEERKTVVVFYYARFKKEKITRTQACGIRLTETQYMQVIHLFLLKRLENFKWLLTATITF
jgi:hypothetical protein